MLKPIRFVPAGTKIRFINKRALAFSLSAIILLTSVVSLLYLGLNFGIDFRGGILMEIRSSSAVNIPQIRDRLSTLGLGEVTIQEFGKETDALVRIQRQDGAETEQMAAIIKVKDRLGSEFEYRRTEFVGPTVGRELKEAGLIAICLALLSILIYIWLRFEWQFSLGAILALFHDVILTLGIFSLFSLEINLSIIAAVLTIVGYSMNDTVVIFDRVRENLRKYSDIKIFELTNISINETLSRTLITSITTLLALLSIFFFGGEILKGFSLAMIFGVIFGTYSSIYIANTVLVRLNVSQKTILKEDTEV